MHAVRWATTTNPIFKEFNYGKWHATEDGSFTLCQRMIRLANEHGTFFPDTDDDLDVVTCKQCLRKLK